MDIVKASGCNNVCIVGDFKWFPVNYLQKKEKGETYDERLSMQLVERYGVGKDRIVGVLWSRRKFHLVNHTELNSLCSDNNSSEYNI